MKLQSGYAMLDVQHGRKNLERHLEKQGPIDVVIYGRIMQPFGNDDGTSMEFNVDVERVEVK